jgi:hypothetical protein
VCPYQCSPPERVMGWAQATFRHYEHRYMNSGSLASSLGLVHRQMSYEYFAHPLSIEPFWCFFFILHITGLAALTMISQPRP